MRRADTGLVHYPGEAIVAQVAPPARGCWVVIRVAVIRSAADLGSQLFDVLTFDI